MPDWAAEGLLDGLDGDARDERAELLDWMYERGYTVAELQRASAEGLVAFLPAERAVMGGPPELTLRDLAQAAGVPVELLVRLRRAQGLPVPDLDERAFSQREAAAAGAVSIAATLGMDDEQIVALTRTFGRGLAPIAHVMRATALELSLQPGTTEKELAERLGLAVEAVMPQVGPMLETMVRQHLRNMVRSEAVDATERATGTLPGARDVGVAFADLVGFTRLGEEVPPEEIGSVAQRLERLAADVVQPPVRMVKTIGDAAMLASPDSGHLVTAALDLVDAVDAEGQGFPQVRVGLAYGPAAQRGGDWFGRPVNLASRITGIARAGSVLVAESARDVAEAAAVWSFAGERRIRGVPEPVKLYRARRPQADA